MGLEAVVTTAEDVLACFNVTSSAQREYDKWRVDGRYKQDVVPHVLRHCTRVAYGLTPQDVQRVCEVTRTHGGHALGWVKRAEVSSVNSIGDWNPAFAFSHLFHHILEVSGRIPTWRQVVEFMNRDETGVLMLGSAVQRAHHEHDRRHGASRVEDALQWRIGNAYYSFLRELHVLTHMRARGLDVRIHPLADTLFRVDAWLENRVLCLYVGNDEYRNEREGRKRKAQEILGTHHFAFEEINLPKAREYGRVHLPSEVDLEGRIRKLLAEVNIAQA